MYFPAIKLKILNKWAEIVMNLEDTNTTGKHCKRLCKINQCVKWLELLKHLHLTKYKTSHHKLTISKSHNYMHMHRNSTKHQIDPLSMLNITTKRISASPESDSLLPHTHTLAHQVDLQYKGQVLAALTIDCLLHEQITVTNQGCDANIHWLKATGVWDRFIKLVLKLMTTKLIWNTVTLPHRQVDKNLQATSCKWKTFPFCP